MSSNNYQNILKFIERKGDTDDHTMLICNDYSEIKFFKYQRRDNSYEEIHANTPKYFESVGIQSFFPFSFLH